ncbi:MAG TPA: TldD/PmbA family protein [Dehalococcoidia bacterium]|nr:TldD/PmbA family protein [Dehalococcoidia bacterium]
MDESLRHRLSHALTKAQADYAEIRLEESQSTRIVYRGQELEDISHALSFGGNVRALVRGGWGFICFDGLDELPSKMELATAQARLVGKESTRFVPVEPVVAETAPWLKRDPDAVALAEKKRLLDEYNEVIWGTPNIQTSGISYSQARRKVILANSEGSYIEQSRTDVTLRITAVARKDGQVQQATLSLGSLGDYEAISGLHGQVEELARRAVALLNAPQLKGGEYTVVLDPVLAGIFAHEAFGHLSESDFVYENQRLKELMVLGRRFGGQHLNIVDDPTLPGLRGSYEYDDEGTPARKSYLIREGVLVGRLHSRETAAKLGEAPTGHARALDYRHPPLVRMSNTFIEPGQLPFSELIADIKEGVYAKNWYGGTTSMEMFTFSAGEAYMIRHGQIAELLKPVVLTGNVFTTLANIDAIGNDLEMNQGGGCGKGDQVPLPVSSGSPHIRIRRCVVGGG